MGDVCRDMRVTAQGQKTNQKTQPHVPPLPLHACMHTPNHHSHAVGLMMCVCVCVTHQVQHAASLNVVVLGSLVIIHLLAGKNEPDCRFGLSV